MYMQMYQQNEKWQMNFIRNKRFLGIRISTKSKTKLIEYIGQLNVFLKKEGN